MMELYSNETFTVACELLILEPIGLIEIYVTRHTSSLPIHGEASAKTALYRERFMLLSQRVSRAEHFSRPAFDAEMSQFENNEVGLSFLFNVFVPVFFWVLVLKYETKEFVACSF